MFLPIVDISRHQGRANLATLRAKGVVGLIIRVGHGKAIDPMFDDYWRQALDIGFTRDDLATYSFINPKRGTGRDTAAVMLDEIVRVVGDTRVGYMLDIESHRGETPNKGQAIVGPALAEHIREHGAYVREQSDAYVFGYSNDAYWSSPDGPRDAALAAELEWLVPRYVPYPPAALVRMAENGNPGPLNTWVANSPKPGTPDTWEAFAFRHGPSGPRPPRGGTWDGWQFSAGYNRQGAVYGFQSPDLDLNIVRPEAWARWTLRTATEPTTPDLIPPTPPEDDMPKIIIQDTALGGAAFLVDGTPVSPEALPVLQAQGFVLVPQDHPYWRAAIMHRNGAQAAALYAELA